ncbi:MAG: hypothetical protein MUC36_01900 [Planctomycetes bacterium]|jgi:hypothetical protein|nr:hypothetical protein [Planctomycetota bacterium]
MNATRMFALGAACAAFVACASSEPGQPSAFDHSGGEAKVVLAPDGFGTLDDERMPLEAIVLRLRWRTRAMPAEQLQRFVVSVWLPAEPGSDELERRVLAAKERMLQELDIMDVGQVYLRVEGGGA